MVSFAELGIPFHLCEPRRPRRAITSCPSSAGLANLTVTPQRLGDTAACRLDQPLVGLATDEPSAPTDLDSGDRRGARTRQQVADRRTGAAQRLDQGDGFPHRLLPGVESLIRFRFFQSIVEDRIEVEVSFA